MSDEKSEKHEHAAVTHGRVSRRQFLKVGLAATGSTLLVACGSKTTSQPKPTSPSAATVVPTQPAPTAAPGPVLGQMVPELEFLNLPFESFQEYVRQFVPEVEKLGVEVNVQVVEPTTWIEKASENHDYGDFTITSFGLSGSRADPDWVLSELLHSRSAEPGRRNMADYKNPELDAIIDAQAGELDEDERMELVRQAQEIFAKDNPFYSVYFLDEIAVYNHEKWEGFIEMYGGGLTRWSNIPSWLNIKSKTGETMIKVDNDHDGNSTNPFVASGGAFNRETMRWVYDTLAIVDTDLSIIPWAAESWTWVDNTTLDVALRSGMRFHDGEPVTAEDLVFTINYAKEHQFAEWASVLANIEGVEATDELTVRFTLPKVYAPFVSTVLPFVFIAPKHIWESVFEPEQFENPDAIGSGPFIFGHWRKNESWRFNRNPDHWSPPNMDVLVSIIPERETLIGLLEIGEIDAVAGSHIRGDDQIAQLEAQPHLTVKSWTSASFVGFFVYNAKLPGSDREFRRALHYVIPKQQLVDVLGGKRGGLVGGSSWIHPSSPWYNPDLPQYEHNIEKARQILADAGYGWDEEGRLHFPA